MKYTFIFIKIILFSFLVINDSNGQRSSEFIYGKVITKSNEQYIGHIRWGKEEFLWHDIFNSEKVRTKRIKSPEDDKPASMWDNFSWNISSIWEDKYSTTTHLFSCFYGDIKSIKPTSSSRLDLELKNGTVIKLDGNSNDVGATLSVFDYELGEVKIKWSKIKSVEFSDGPYGEPTDFGQPLYGTLKTRRKGEFTGYIKWDLHERTTEDILDGDNGNEKVAFKHIKSIYKRERGVDVILNSDREVYLSGSNDVNSSNNGIAVYVHGVGSVEVEWRDFESLHLFENPNEGLAYSDFGTPSGMSAEVITYDHEYNGMIVFDVDEKWEMEFIDAKDDKISYQIPFYFVKSIVPKNSSFSVVKLNSGQVLLLGDSHDLSSRNNGLLVFKNGEKEPDFIKWNDVIEIIMK